MRSIFRYRFLPEFILILAGLIAGLTLFRNYGASWDEPDLYRYAAQSLQAYSIHDRVEGQFNLESLLGPDNLRLYGPAYLVFGQIVVNLLHNLTVNILDIDLWHLVNFLIFILGVLLFYKLLMRWFSIATSFIATVLFASQPVIFGISWIDPKDIPFMVLFIASIYYGLNLIDNVETILNTQGFRTKSVREKPVSKKWIKNLTIASGFLAFFSVMGWIFKPSIVNSLQQTVLGIYTRSEGDFVLRVFNTLAKNRDSIPLQAYSDKAVLLFAQALTTVTAIAIICALVATSLWLYPSWVSRFGSFTGKVLIAIFMKPSRFSMNWKMIGLAFFAGAFLGVTTSTRVLGPLAGFLIALELFRRLRWKSLPVLIVYGVTAIVVTLITWPYLWQNTINRFFEVFFHMAENPVGVGVLFQGTVYDSKQLPAGYLPWLMLVTLTIPAVLTGIAGVIIFLVNLWKRTTLVETWIMVAWFLIPFGYVLALRPPMYDNYRHFLFIIPAFFFFCAESIDRLSRLREVWIKAIAALVILIPGIVGIVRNHPYEYSYYNELAGGIKGAVGKYEVDYWLTCYRELTVEVNNNEKEADYIFAAFMPNLVRYYANSRFQIFKANDPVYPPESLVFLPLRREGLTLYSDLPMAYEIKKDGVTLCAARRVEP